MVFSEEQFVHKINEDLKSFDIKEASKEAKIYHAGLVDTFSMLQNVATSPADILIAEGVLIGLNLGYFETRQETKKNNLKEDKTVVHSLKVAQEEITKAKDAFFLVQDHVKYKDFKSGLAPKDISNKLPLDGLRKFQRSHNTRLKNLLTSSLSGIEKDIIKQRQKNLIILRDHHIKMQRKALGMPEKDKDQGR